MWIRAVLLVVLTFCLVSFVLFSIYWKLNSEEKTSTSLAYKISIKQSSYEDLFDKISVVAKRNELIRNSKNMESRQEVRWISSKNYGVYIFSPISTGAGSDDVKVHVSIFDASGKNLTRWKALSKEVEGVLFPYLLSDAQATLQLDPEVYGTCPPSSEKRNPGGVCFFLIQAPVDFDEISSRILTPRGR